MGIKKNWRWWIFFQSRNLGKRTAIRVLLNKLLPAMVYWNVERWNHCSMQSNIFNEILIYLCFKFTCNFNIILPREIILGLKPKMKLYYPKLFVYSTLKEKMFSGICHTRQGINYFSHLLLKEFDSLLLSLSIWWTRKK